MTKKMYARYKLLMSTWNAIFLSHLLTYESRHTEWIQHLLMCMSKIYKTYTSAIEEGMFSSTHFRSSSWRTHIYFYYYQFVQSLVKAHKCSSSPCVMKCQDQICVFWVYKRKFSYHFTRFCTSIGLWFKTSHFYALCE